MRRILFPILTIGVVAGMFSIGSGAFFSDTETSTDNIFTAGTLDLTLTDSNETAQDGVTASFSAGGIVPGSSGGATLTINNAGSIAGSVDLSGITVTHDENGCTEPEEGDDGESCSDDTNDLEDELLVKVCFAASAVADCGGVGSIYGGAAGLPLSGIAASYDLDEAIAAAGSLFLRIDWALPTSVNNSVQSDTATLDLTVELDQTDD